MTLILASNNRGKYNEFKTLFEGRDVNLVPQLVAGVNFEVNETGETFAENAYLKASTVYEYTHFGAIADDSGLCVEALDGAPGLHSARFGGGKEWTDRQKYEYLLQLLRGEQNRRAKFVTEICCVLPGGKILRAVGECPGRILTEPRGDGGFGYDPVFAPDGYDQSFAELGTEEKNKISHRARALRAFWEEWEREFA